MGGSGVQGLWESGSSAIATDSTSECSGWASVVFWARGSHGSEALGQTLSELPSSGVVPMSWSLQCNTLTWRIMGLSKWG